ncbi:MAG: hypothetical protein WC164_03010 [Patescibacteria group bacterium]
MKLSKLYFLPLFLVLIFSLSACGQKNNSNQENNSSQESSFLENDNGEESYFSSSVTEMFKEGKPLECSAEINDAYADMTAVYYFDNKNERVRVEMKTIDKEQGLEINSVSIIKDNWSYFWDDLTNKDGMKINLEEDDEDLSSEDLEDEDELVDMDEVFDFKCKSWKVDNSKFDLPKDKNFKDLSSLMNTFNQSIPVSSGQGVDENSFNMQDIDLCAYCEMIEDLNDKQECLDSCK